MDDLPQGTRVVAYWSEKYSYLFPGTIGERVEDPKTKDNSSLVIVELDDGDDRAIHYSNIRFLPPDYPIVGEWRNCNTVPIGYSDWPPSTGSTGSAVAIFKENLLENSKIYNNKA